MTERFGVAGALLVKLFGRPDEEDAPFADRAGRVRDIGVQIAMSSRVLLLRADPGRRAGDRAGLRRRRAASRSSGTLTVGTLLALAALLGRLYGPLTALSNVRVDVMTALVSFERVFEVLDLAPIDRRPRRTPAAAARPRRRHRARRTSRFRYPRADEVCLAASRRSPAAEARESGAGAARRQLHRRAGPDGRAGRAVGRRQDDHQPAWCPALRRRRPARCGSAASTCAT